AWEGTSAHDEVARMSNGSEDGSKGKSEYIPYGPRLRTAVSATEGDRVKTEATRSAGSDITSPASVPFSRTVRTSPPHRSVSRRKNARNGLNHGDRSARSSASAGTGCAPAGEARPIISRPLGRPHYGMTPRGNPPALPGRSG